MKFVSVDVEPANPDLAISPHVPKPDSLMPRFIWIAFLLVCLFPPAAHAQSCFCGSAIPANGLYQASVDYAPVAVLELIVDDDQNECGQHLVLSGDGRVGNFTCVDGVYYGEIPTDIGQTTVRFGPLNSSDWLTTSFIGQIVIPGRPDMGDFTMELMTEATQAPECICQEVEEWITHGQAMRSIYQDQAIIDVAVDRQQAGLSPGEKAWPNGIDDDAAYPTTRSVAANDSVFSTELRSYQEMISERRSLTLDAEQHSGAAAWVDTLTCEPTLALPKNSSGICRPPVVIDAINLHEAVHMNRCLDLTGENPPSVAYSRWSNHPPNHALDEVQAYSAQVDHMKSWFDAQCCDDSSSYQNCGG